MTLRLVTSSAGATRGLGEAIGRVATGLLALLLIGDYGSGKTTFVQGVAAGLGIDGPVRSPSYNIVKRYSQGRLVLVHADLYRTHSNQEIEELGLVEILGPDGILAVEWPGRYLPPFAGMPAVTVYFSMPPRVPGGDEAPPNERRLEISWSPECPAQVVEVLRAVAAR
jgi:tRNA threonylcarbamoyladenosine biosynthesis protein TsaE